MDVENNAEHSRLKPSIVLVGTAKDAGTGPPIGLVYIGVSDHAHLFRVALPGLRKHESKLKCDINRNGKVCIRGVITDGAVVKDSSSVFQMIVQELCPPGLFTVSFNLPGPVDARLFSAAFCPDGILEGVVMKLR